VKFQTNKCHRGKGCRWIHQKIPSFDPAAHAQLKAAAFAKKEIDASAEGSKPEQPQTADQLLASTPLVITKSKSFSSGANEPGIENRDGFERAVGGELHLQQRKAETSFDSEEEDNLPMVGCWSANPSGNVVSFDDGEDFDEVRQVSHQQSAANVVSFDEDDEDSESESTLVPGRIIDESILLNAATVAEVPQPQNCKKQATKAAPSKQNIVAKTAAKAVNVDVALKGVVKFDDEEVDQEPFEPAHRQSNFFEDDSDDEAADASFYHVTVDHNPDTHSDLLKAEASQSLSIIADLFAEKTTRATLKSKGSSTVKGKKR
jgi:hypothetical protein